jgi:hypothetical protein
MAMAKSCFNHIEVPLYKNHVAVIFGKYPWHHTKKLAKAFGIKHDIEGFEKRMKEMYLDDPDSGPYVGLTITLDYGRHVIWFPDKNPGINIVVHECFHCANRIMEYHKAHGDEESKALLLEHLVEEVLKMTGKLR